MNSATAWMHGPSEYDVSTARVAAVERPARAAFRAPGARAAAVEWPARVAAAERPARAAFRAPGARAAAVEWPAVAALAEPPAVAVQLAAAAQVAAVVRQVLAARAVLAVLAVLAARAVLAVLAVLAAVIPARSAFRSVGRERFFGFVLGDVELNAAIARQLVLGLCVGHQWLCLPKALRDEALGLDTALVHQIADH